MNKFANSWEFLKINSCKFLEININSTVFIIITSENSSFNKNRTYILFVVSFEITLELSTVLYPYIILLHVKTIKSNFKYNRI